MFRFTVCSASSQRAQVSSKCVCVQLSVQIKRNPEKKVQQTAATLRKKIILTVFHCNESNSISENIYIAEGWAE